MKRRTMNTLLVFTLVTVLSLPLLQTRTAAQKPTANGKTNTRILYHGGPIVAGLPNVYLILYGDWNGGLPGSNFDTHNILADFVTYLGGSPYFAINTTYSDSADRTPSGGMIYNGTITVSYSHGPTLTVPDIQSVIADLITSNTIPLDPNAIYVVIGSSDVTDIRADGRTTFCTPNTPPHHGTGSYNGSPFMYAFIGNAERCPASAAPQFFADDGSRLPTPNNNFAADAMASTLAHALAGVVTNRAGNGWFDKFGLENAAKCQGTFGTTYTSTNGARANMRLHQRDFLIQQNWVNVGKGYCALSYP